MTEPTSPPPALSERLGLNRSTAALLLAILCIGMGQELWAPYMPRFLQERIEGWTKTGAWGLDTGTLVLVAVGVYGTWKDLQEAFYYWAGGRIGEALGPRRALLLFAGLPLCGYVLLLAWASPLAPFVALPLVTAYDSVAGPATLSVVGDTLKERYRTIAISLQSIQRRIPRIVAYLSGGALVGALGAIGGVRAGLAISIPLVLLALVIQWRHLRPEQPKAPAAREAPARSTPSESSLALLRRFDPQLRTLLVADILARLAEGMPRELFVLYAVAAAAGGATGHGVGAFGLTSELFGSLLALQAFVSLITYLPVGWATSASGNRKPYVGLTFVFFSAFPASFFLLGTAGGLGGLVAAYVVAGLRELGEPARKAIITELVPQESRTAAIGVYWAARCLAVSPAPLIGALLWIRWGPAAPFLVASGIGVVGAAAFFLGFRRR